MSRRRKLSTSPRQQANPVPTNGVDIAYRADGNNGNNGNNGSSDSYSSSLRQSSSILQQRAQFGSRFGGYNLHGLSFNGRRDLNTALGYNRYLDITHFFARYKRGGIAKRCVEIFPEAVWSDGFDVVEDPDPDIVTPFEDMVAGLIKRLNLSTEFMSTDILTNLGRYGAILIGAPGPFNTEMPRMSSPDEIKYLTPLAEDNAKVLTLNTDETSERFGQPETYQVTLGSSTSMLTGYGNSGRMTGTIMKTVHWSRIIHFAKGCIEGKIYGTPLLEAVWDDLDDFYKVKGGGAEAAWRRMNPPTVYNLSPDVTFPDETAKQQSLQAMRDRIEDIDHGMERSALTSGVDVSWLNSKAELYGPNCEIHLKIIAGTLGVPMRRLVGSEMGELASGQDENNFDDRVASERTRHSTSLPTMLFDRLITYGALPAVDQYEVVWPTGQELSEDQKFQMVLTLAHANQAQGKDIVQPNEIRARVLDMEPLDELEPDYVDPNAPEIPPVVVSPVDPNADPSNPPAAMVEASSGLPVASGTARIVILGGPRHGKSTLAREYRDNGKMPTFCGDPGSLVKEPEDGVTYLPDTLSWSECSAYIAEKWLSSPGPWVCEGVSMARALRKLISMVESGESDVCLDDIQIIVLSTPKIQLSEGQAAMAKGVETVWSGIKERFANVYRMDSRNHDNRLSHNSGSVRMANSLGGVATGPRVVNPLKSKTGLRVAHRPKLTTKPKQFLFERLNG